MADNKLAPPSKNKLPWYEQALPMEGRAAFLPYQDTMPGSVMNPRLVAALLQQELDAAQRPATMNPNLAAQGRRMNLPARQGPGPFAEFATQAASLDPQPDQGYGTMAAEMALGFVPGVGQALAARDIERARRDNDPLGMGMAASSFVPFGKMINALRGRKQMGPVSELITYHGSPHRFPPTANNPLGEFDPTKIGTGEGAQAYGHGLYFAEDKDLANVYRRKLTGGDGSPVAHPDQSIQVQIGRLQNQVKQLEQSGDASAPAMIKAYQNRIAELDRAGNLYKVDLPDEQIAKMLDYDKPLSQQPEALKTIRGLVPADMLKTFDANVKGGISGANAYKNYIPSQSYAIRDAGATNYKPSAAKTFEDALAEVGGDTSRLRVINDRSEAKVSEMLRAQGIPGIRYLDEGSRAAGEGTSNFVVFDPAHMNILERNGVTAASLRNVAPQDEALRLAQQRAALPVEQHGLGLPADNTPQQRAAAMGAEFGWGHGSNNPDITTFKPSKTGAQGPGIYATNYLPETNMYSSLKDTGNTSYPLAVFKDEALISKLNNPYDELKVAADDELISELFKRNKSAIITNQEPTPDWLLKQGVSEYPERQHYVSVNPDNFRSRFAAFDPWRRNSALAASLGVAAPDLLAQENK